MTGSPTRALTILATNDRFDERHDHASFVGRLHEDCTFDVHACEALEAAIVEAMRGGATLETIGTIVRILGHLLRLTRASLDQRDVFTIDNLEPDQVDELDARVHYLLIEVSYGRVPALEHWPAPAEFAANPREKKDPPKESSE